MSGDGRFIVFEGGEGTGKSTQATSLAERLGAILTSEPGDTPVGAELRRLLLDRSTGPLDDRTEALMMAADRAQHVATVVRPALEEGRTVVCDRYAFSSIAYQGYGRGLDPDDVRELSEWATDGLWPDLVLLLDVPARTAMARLEDTPDRFEAEGEEFHRRVNAGFLAQALAAPDLWAIIDGEGTVDEVADRVDAAVADRLGPTL